MSEWEEQDMTEQRLLVKREGDFTYPITFYSDFSGLSREVESLENRGKRLCIVTDSHVAPLYLETVKKELEKRWNTGIHNWTMITKNGFNLIIRPEA